MQQHEQRFSDAETDEAMRLPSRKVFVVLTVVGLFMLALAWLSSAQITTPAPASPAATSKASAVDTAASRRSLDLHQDATGTLRHRS